MGHKVVIICIALSGLFLAGCILKQDKLESQVANGTELSADETFKRDIGLKRIHFMAIGGYVREVPGVSQEELARFPGVAVEIIPGTGDDAINDGTPDVARDRLERTRKFARDYNQLLVAFLSQN